MSSNQWLQRATNIGEGKDIGA